MTKVSTSVISDIHMHPEGGIEKKTFDKFSSNELVKKSQTIIFLGDIFDVLVGDHQEYLETYHFFFNFVSQAVSEGKTIHYIEGNHDFHLASLFNSLLNNNNLFHYHKGGFSKHIRGKNIYFSHGDDIDTTDWFYTHYRRFISSNFFKLFNDAFIPHSWVEKIGHYAAKRSRNRNHHKYPPVHRSAALKKKVRLCAEKAHKLLGFDVLVCGHSHVKDEYQSPNGFLYINNGYAPQEQTFIHIDKNISFVHL